MLYGIYAAGASKAGLDVMNRNKTESFLRRLGSYTENIYVDTHSMSKAAVLCATEILGKDKVLFGSDYPITPDSFGMAHGLKEINGIDNADVRNAILGDSAKHLLKL
jgi:predicted TIM-barrel fold metal-dependent hydrolase